MSQTSFLDRLAGRFRGHAKKAAATYQGLIEQLADGREPDLASAEGIVREAGKTTQDVSAAVERLVSRRAAAAALHRGKAAQKELEAVRSRMAAADAAREAAVAELANKHAEATAELQRRVHELQAAMDAGRRGEQLLRDTAIEDPRLAELRERLAAARRERDRHAQQASKARLAAKQAWVSAQARDYSDLYRAGYAEEAERQEAATEQHLKTAEPHDAEVKRIEAEIAEVEGLALVP